MQVSHKRYDCVMSDTQTGKPDDKKEKGGDKADDKVSSRLFHTCNALLLSSTIRACFVFNLNLITFAI